MGEIFVEVIPRSNGDLKALPNISENFSQRAGEIADSIVTISKELRSALIRSGQAGKGAWQPKEVEVSFDLALEVESGVLIAKATASGTFGVRIMWTRESES